MIPQPVVVKKLFYQQNGKTILDDISFVLQKNEFVGLIGGSGSGKTSLIKCLLGLKEASSGRVFMSGLSADKLGYVPQEDIVHPTLTVQSALKYSFLLRVKEAGVSPEERVETVLRQLDLWDHRFKKISNLSGGQRKRVNIGVELLHSPELFFLDEPTAGLDPSLEYQLMKLMKSLSDENRLVLVTTHVMQHIEWFDILIFIHKGQLVYFGPPGEILRFFGSDNIFELFEKVGASQPGIWKMKFRESPLHEQFIAARLRGVSPLG